MIPRTFALFFRLIVLGLFLTQIGHAQTEKKYVAPRTAAGQPDLQGYWTNSTYTPLERPANITKEFYTAEEAALIAKQNATREVQQTVPGTTEDVHYDFTQFGLDRSQGAMTGNLRTSLIVDPADGRLPPLSAEGRRRATALQEATRGVGRWDAAQTNQLDDRCIITPGVGPPMLENAYNSNYQIVQTPGYVMILVEMFYDVRIIPLDGGAHVPQSVRLWTGNSRGHWEGDTLVVETTNFNGKNPLRGSSENMRVTERFTRTSADTIQYRFTVEDPATWTRPWSAELPMKKTHGPLFEVACHEGNYGLYNTLVGARLEEKRAAEKQAK